MEDADSNIPELPEGIKRASTVLRSKSKSATIRNAESARCIHIEMDQDFDEIVSPATGRGRFQFERQVLADLSIAMSVNKQRFLLERIEPKKGWRKLSVIELLVLPDEQGHPPSCDNLASQIAEEVNKGSLNAMPSMRRAVRAEIHDKDASEEASNRPIQQEGELKFSLLRGGIFFDPKHFSSQGADDSSYASHGAVGIEPGLDHEGLRIALALQEKEMAAARRQKDERRFLLWFSSATDKRFDSSCVAERGMDSGWTWRLAKRPSVHQDPKLWPRDMEHLLDTPARVKGSCCGGLPL